MSCFKVLCLMVPQTKHQIAPPPLFLCGTCGVWTFLIIGRVMLIIKVKCKATRNKRTGIWTLTVVCPFCGKTHVHGGGHFDVPMIGTRVPHCDKPADGQYELVL